MVKNELRCSDGERTLYYLEVTKAACLTYHCQGAFRCEKIELMRYCYHHEESGVLFSAIRGRSFGKRHDVGGISPRSKAGKFGNRLIPNETLNFKKLSIVRVDIRSALEQPRKGGNNDGLTCRMAILGAH